MKRSVSRTEPSGKLTLNVTWPPAAITISVEPAADVDHRERPGAALQETRPPPPET